MLCSGSTKAGNKCKREVNQGELLCWQHNDKKVVNKKSAVKVIGDITLFNNLDNDLWEKEYQKIMYKKYIKNSRKFHIEIPTTSYNGEAHIYQLIDQFFNYLSSSILLFSFNLLLS